jgi:hypothetical protein
MTEPLSAKLAFALKVFSISRSQLAARLEVDKSVVGRWLNGVANPSAHNMARLTAMAAERAPGFTAVDWDLDLAGLARRLGVDTAIAASVGPRFGDGLPLDILDLALTHTQQRGEAYEGIFRSTRPLGAQPGRFQHDHGMIRREPNGLLRLTMVNGRVNVDGWMLPLQGQLFCVAHERTSGALVFGIFHGVNMPKAMVIDGMILGSVLDAGRTPTASLMLFERIADLTGDRDADDARFKALSDCDPLAPEGSVPQALVEHLVRDNGPTELGCGGDWLMRLPVARTWSHGDESRPPVSTL